MRLLESGQVSKEMGGACPPFFLMAINHLSKEKRMPNLITIIQKQLEDMPKKQAIRSSDERELDKLTCNRVMNSKSKRRTGSHKK
jgi:hypothetical protein